MEKNEFQEVQSNSQISLKSEQKEEEYSQDLVNASKKIAQKFNQCYQHFKLGENNIFELENPLKSEVLMVIQIWQSRPQKDMIFTLILNSHDSLVLQKAEKIFHQYPSIKLILNGKQIENDGIVEFVNGCHYEGSNKSMIIQSTERDYYYMGQVEDKKQHGKGYMQSGKGKDRIIYQGQFKNGKMHGKGQMSAGKIDYIGEFQNDFKNGKGEQIVFKKARDIKGKNNAFVEKSRYNGSFKNGERQGEGEETSAYGKYIGQWKNGLKKGIGKFYFKNGDQYEGEWDDNEINGKGKKIQVENSQYEGQFKNAKYQGQGQIKYENGDEYTGSWKEGKKHGQGVYKWSDEDYYDGEWQKDSASGFGVSMVGSQYYEGEWKNGKKHGEGELTDDEGNTKKALWENGVLKKLLQFNGQPVDDD